MWKVAAEWQKEGQKILGCNFVENKIVKPYNYVNSNFSFASYFLHSSEETIGTMMTRVKRQMRAHAFNFILIRLKSKRIFMFAQHSQVFFHSLG